MAEPPVDGVTADEQRTSDGQPIRCHCGAILADRIDGMNVVIDGTEYQFRRKSDKLTCPDCRYEHPMRSLRPSPAPEPRDSGARRRRDDRLG